MKLALFDFDGTLIPFDSADLWVADTARNAGGGNPERFRKLRPWLFPHPWLRGGRHKRWWLKLLQGVSVDAAAEATRNFMSTTIQPALIPAMTARLDGLRSEGIEPVLVSANYQPLLAEVARILDVAHVIGCGLEVVDGKYSGRMQTPNCIGMEKVRRLHAHFPGTGIQWADSWAFGDSRSDLPMLRMTGNPVVVHQGPPPSWARTCGIPLEALPA